MEEWDWPPPRFRRVTAPTIDGRIESESVILRRTPKKGWPDRAADIFFTVVWTSAKIVATCFLSAVVLGCAWLIGALLKAAG